MSVYNQLFNNFVLIVFFLFLIVKLICLQNIFNYKLALNNVFSKNYFFIDVIFTFLL